MADHRYEEGYGTPDDSRRGHGQRADEREAHGDAPAWRRGGGYGIGGASRGYNQGGWSPTTYEEGYAHRSYDRLLGAPEHDEDLHDDPVHGRAARLGQLGYAPSMLPILGRPRALGIAPRGYVRSDERIREDICERLINSPYDASDVDIQVKDAEVTLTGTVRSRQERRDIEDLIVAVRGVHDVFNHLRAAEGSMGRSLH